MHLLVVYYRSYLCSPIPITIFYPITIIYVSFHMLLQRDMQSVKCAEFALGLQGTSPGLTFHKHDS